MSKERATRLYYTGDGSQFFVGVPARDLEPEDVAALSDEQYDDITADGPATGKPLYQKSEPASRKAAKAPTRKAPSKQPAKAASKAAMPELAAAPVEAQEPEPVAEPESVERRDQTDSSGER